MNKKVLVIFCFLFVPCTATGDVNPIRLKALLQICDAARLSSDLGTIKERLINGFGCADVAA